MRVQRLVPLFLMLGFETSGWTLVGAEVLDADDKEAVLVALPQDISEEDRVETVKAIKKLISDTSSFLRISTGLPIAKVNILIPEPWNTDSEDWKEFGDISYSTSSEKPSNADIAVETSGPYKEGPAAIQHRHCGLQGRRIVLPVEFLAQGGTSNKAKLLAREWIKYRYGVFDENGFQGDSRFPEYYRIPGSAEEEVKINDCANVPVNYTFVDEDGQNCSLEVDVSSGLPIDNSTCFFRVVPEDNGEVRTSVMVRHLQNISNVDTVCDNVTYPHNSDAPNKQNVFCNGQSIAEVMEQHTDYKMSSLTFAEDVTEPTFHLVKTQNFRIVVAVHETEGLRKLKDLVKNSLDILTFSLPNNSELGLLKFKGSAVTQLMPLTKLRDSFIERDDVTKEITFLFRDEIESNPEDAINAAVEMLIPDDAPRSGTIVVIADTDPLSPNSNLKHKYKYICLVVIVTKKDDAAAFEKFIGKYGFDATCSKVFRAFGNDFAALEQINEAFNFVIDINDYQDQHILIKGAELTSKSPLSLVIDESVSSFDIWLTGDTEKNVGGDDFQFSELGVIRQLQETKKSNQQITLFRVEEPKAGVWECKLTYENERLLAKVITRTKNGTDSTRLKAWIEVEQTNDEHQSPIILYAEVFSGAYPILHASIEARVISSDGNETILDLLDNGLGDPDVTANDGIYSRYFTQFTTVGNYNVTVTAGDNNGVAIIGHESDFHSCCGSKVKYVDTGLVSMFKITNVVTFTTTSEKPEDGYEPSQVLDLRAMETTMPSTFTLQWTAPGNEKDHDTAKEYELKVFKTRDDASKSFESNETHLQALNPEEFISPSPYGTLQTVDIQLNDRLPLDVAYYVCLRTISQNGKASKVSNIVEIFYSSRIGTAGTDDPISVTPVEDEKRSPISTGTAIGIAVGAFLAVVALVIIGYLSFHCYNKKKKAQRKKDVESNGEAKSNVASNLPKEIDGSVRANDWKLDQDPISPVNSVPAKVLLLHHEQVKDARLKNQDPPLFTLQRLQENKEDAVQADSSSEDTTEPKDQSQENEVPEDHDQPSHSKSKRRTTNV